MATFGKKTTLASEATPSPAEPTASPGPVVAPGPVVEAAPVVSPAVEQPAAASAMEASGGSLLTGAALPPDKQAAIDKIMADARSAAEAILLGTPAATLGTPSGDIEEKTARVARDFVPGKRRKDKTYIPEYVCDQNSETRRKVLRYDVYRYMLVDGETIDNYSLMGYRMALFDGGSMSGLEGKGFTDTGDSVFRRDIYGRCQRGDCFLMYIPIRAWEEIAQDDRDEVDKALPAALGSFANAAYSVGIRPFIEAEGKTLT